MLFCYTSNSMIKVWHMTKRQCLYIIEIDSYDKFLLKIHINYGEDIISINTRRIYENSLNLQNLDNKSVVIITGQTDSSASMKYYKNIMSLYW